MTWAQRVALALARLEPDERAWLDRLPPDERAVVLQVMVELCATPER